MSTNDLEVERLYFNLFPTKREEAFMRMLIIVVFEHIRALGRVSQTHLCNSVSKYYPYTEEDIMIALSALNNPSIFGVISRFELADRPNARVSKVTQLSVKNDKLSNYMDWYNYVSDQFTELKKIAT
jgi:hypothetical protein